MKVTTENAAIAGVGAAACAACCAGPILGILGAIGLGTAAGVALFGTVAIAIGAVVATIFVRRRRRAAGATCAPPAIEPVEVAFTPSRSRP